MGTYRRHSIQFERQVAQSFIAGETVHGLAKRTACPAIPSASGWPSTSKARSTTNPRRSIRSRPTRARTAALERLAGQQALELEFLQGR
jgi:transposase